MHSQSVVRRATVLLLIGIILLGLSVELVTRKFIYRMSASLGRMNEESISASQIRRSAKAPRQILLMGNSLLLTDVDMAQLNSQLQPDWVAIRYGVSQSSYFDWHYGLRRLIAEGARPDIVMFCFEPRHIVQASVSRNEIFAHYLLQTSDLLGAGRAMHQHPTDIFDMLVANISTFHALRKEIRKNILMGFLPDLPNLTALMAKSAHPLAADSDILSVGRDHLLASRDIALASSIRFALLIVPPSESGQINILKSIGEKTEIPVLAPMDYSLLHASDYESDDYHLNPIGRQKFTEALIPVLSELLKEHARQNPI